MAGLFSRDSMSAQVHVLTFLSKTHIDKRRYAVSIDVTQRKKVDSVKKKRKTEEQVYIEHESVVGSCSPEIELTLKNKKSDIQFTISGALKPQSELEEGEDILEYNSSLSECRRLLALAPTYDQETQGNATIKFKVDGKVKHTVTIHDVPMIRSLSTTSSEASFVDVRGAETERQMSVLSVNSQTGEDSETPSDFTTDANDTINEGSTKESIDSASGEGHGSGGVEASPVPPRSLDKLFANMAIRNRGQDGTSPVGLPGGPNAGALVSPQVGPNAGAQVSPQVGPNAGAQVSPQVGPQYVPPVASQHDVETAYDKILCNESLSTLSGVLSPSDASRLLIGLRVPNSVLETNKKNHQGDVVSANYQSFLHWRSQKSSRKQEQEASNKFLYEDLLMELQDIGRKDIKVKIKEALEGNKRLEKNEFARL